jgi:hypothetical protein
MRAAIASSSSSLTRKRVRPGDDPHRRSEHVRLWQCYADRL